MSAAVGVPALLQQIVHNTGSKFSRLSHINRALKQVPYFGFLLRNVTNYVAAVLSLVFDGSPMHIRYSRLRTVILGARIQRSFSFSLLLFQRRIFFFIWL